MDATNVETPGARIVAVERKRPREKHLTGRIGWLRAAVLGANDGIVSTASLVIGVASAGAPRSQVLVAGVAGLVAGALSMAAGEYVSVSSQADTERAEIERERIELRDEPDDEQNELAAIYVGRGLEAHARDELGLHADFAARPLQAALASAATFAVGAGLPLLTVTIAPAVAVSLTVAAASLACLVTLGALAARTGGAPAGLGALRVGFWGALAMAITAAAGALFGAAV